ncbi:flavin-containing monooxygenase [[Mycobacterium] burgundiense]|uniref:NAD(P)/FAD-dependent oxidoreductase n=1 Tax=[Mycobacterium] burgundiense TaxID=3064286 RepID=A0ABM9M2Q4_9MYCO|nr:NAD(P)/FAD-dependent oxidoreductase [Mycolicibacterium sp. MU0053]CAJ1509184.1 NAD(P)/FAD-dependent oxidoreductase [Mycolicibacterium sp. MU0053]
MAVPQYEFIIVGAGFGGIGAAIQLRRLGYDNLVILDREDDLGGTWHVNHYPGLAVDVPTTTYSYSFEPNPNWSRLYTPGPEIKQYAADIADKYDVRGYMRFNTVVESARWDDEAKTWAVTLRDGDVLTTRYLITATGFLSQPKTPDIPGITTFEGRVIHTTDWDDDYDPAGQRVAVIGTGATAVQLIPELARRAADLTVYQRTPIWVVPKIDVRFGRLARGLFTRVPATQRAVRAITDAVYEFLVYVGVLRYDSVGRLNVAARVLAHVHRFASIRDRQVRRKLTPDYEFGCKRPTFSNTYYRTFAKPHVHLQADGIERIEADGIVNADGTKTVIDTLVLATGFDLWEANFPAIEVIGRDGRNLGKWWRDTRFQAYQGITVPFFPNFLSLASPYAFLGLNFFNTMEYQMRHMDRLFGELQRRGATVFEITADANARYLDQMTEMLGDSLFTTGNCATARSYYYNPAGEATLLRPMTTKSALTEASTYPVTDYEFS